MEPSFLLAINILQLSIGRYFLAAVNAETDGLVGNDLFMAASRAAVDVLPIIAAARAKCIIIGQPPTTLRAVSLDGGRFYRR
jgi:hypothetical protein